MLRIALILWGSYLQSRSQPQCKYDLFHILSLLNNLFVMWTIFVLFFLRENKLLETTTWGRYVGAWILVCNLEEVEKLGVGERRKLSPKFDSILNLHFLSLPNSLGMTEFVVFFLLSFWIHPPHTSPSINIETYHKWSNWRPVSNNMNLLVLEDCPFSPLSSSTYLFLRRAMWCVVRVQTRGLETAFRAWWVNEPLEKRAPDELSLRVSRVFSGLSPATFLMGIFVNLPRSWCCLQIHTVSLCNKYLLSFCEVRWAVNKHI